MLLPEGASFLPPPHTITTYSRPADLIYSGRGVAGGRQFSLPKQLSRELSVDSHPAELCPCGFALAVVVIPGIVHKIQPVIESFADESNGFALRKLGLSYVIATHSDARNFLTCTSEHSLLDRIRRGGALCRHSQASEPGQDSSSI
jgi:hypothetical protein